MIESLIFPSCPAAAHARLIAATLALGSRPSTSSTKADFDGPVSPSRPFGWDDWACSCESRFILVPFGDDLDLPGPESSSATPPLVSLLPDRPNLRRVLPNRLSLIVPWF